MLIALWLVACYRLQVVKKNVRIYLYKWLGNTTTNSFKVQSLIEDQGKGSINRLRSF